MIYSLTVFDHPRWWDKQQRYIYDNKTHRRIDIDGWDKFVRFFYKMAERPLDSKQDAELISPAVFHQPSTRKNEFVIEWANWCCVDVDDYIPEGNIKDDLVRQFGHYKFICYSTASSTKAHPKFRLVFPLTNPVEREKIRHFWHSLQTELGDLGDKQTKDFARMYYIPANYKDANNFIFVNCGGTEIDPSELMYKHPYEEKSNLNNFFDRLPAEMQKQIVEHRKSKLDNTSITWTSYRDCPFFPRKLEAEYRSITHTGWYRKMYQIMVAIAGNAVKRKYPITATEIAVMCKELDSETGNWYANRPIEREADGAIEYVYKNI